MGTRSGPLAAMFCLLGAGCGSTGATPTPGPRGIVFPVTFALTGFVSASGTFTDAASANTSTSCASFGGGGIAGTYFIPSPPAAQKLNNQRFAYQSVVAAYHGPGRYTDVHALVDFTAGDGVFTGGAGASLSLTSRADGSGHVEFVNFTDVADPRRVIAGTLDWTCTRAT